MTDKQFLEIKEQLNRIREQFDELLLLLRNRM